jgi:hypothetical protein
MGTQSSKNVECGEWQCCAQRETRMKLNGSYCPDFKSMSVTPVAPRLEMTGSPESNEAQFGVGLVFRNMRDGKLVVDSFIKDSSAYQSGVVRDGGNTGNQFTHAINFSSDNRRRHPYRSQRREHRERPPQPNSKAAHGPVREHSGAQILPPGRQVPSVPISLPNVLRPLTALPPLPPPPLAAKGGLLAGPSRASGLPICPSPSPAPAAAPSAAPTTCAGPLARCNPTHPPTRTSASSSSAAPPPTCSATPRTRPSRRPSPA